METPAVSWKEPGHAPAQALEPSDRINTGLFLGVILWAFDHGLTLLADHLGNSSYFFKAFALLTIAFTAMVSPFFIARRVFQIPLWINVPHTIGDRIWSVLLGVISQLAVDVFLLHWVSPGKMVMSLLYAVICGFGATSDYRSFTATKVSPIDFAPAKPDANELKNIRRRVQVATVVFALCLLIVELVVKQIIPVGGRMTVYILLLCAGFAIPALLFNKVHNRCPRCRKALPGDGVICPSCGLGL